MAGGGGRFQIGRTRRGSSGERLKEGEEDLETACQTPHPEEEVAW